jgi:4-amino-4-deoxy-L-arabinose transferase-like glycosyltransferase
MRPGMRRGTVLILTLVVALTVLISPWTRELFVGDETKYAQVVREMRGGSLLVPTLNGQPYTHKPPLHFWGITLLTRLFGLYSIWPFVLQSIIGFFVLLMLVRRVTSDLYGDRSAVYAPFVYATFLLVWGLAQTARMDITFTALITFSVLMIYRALRTGQTRRLYWAAIAIGLAILIKGPMAIVMPLLMVIFERLRTRRLQIGASDWIIPFVIAAVIPLAWLVPALMAGGSAYGEELLVKQNVGRAIGSWVHKEPPWFYITNFPAAFFPWFLTAIIAFFALRRRATSRDARESTGFCLSWFFSVFIPFSLLSGKLHVYMLAAIAPAAVMISAFLAEEREDRWSRMATRANVILLLLFGLVFAAVVPLAPRFLKPEPENALLQNGMVQGLFWTTAAAALVAMIVSLSGREGRAQRSSFALAITALVPLIYASIFLMPLANSLSSTSPLVKALASAGVPPREIALHFTPHLWTRAMPRELEAVRMIGPRGLAPEHGPLPAIVVTRRDHARDLSPELEQSYLPESQLRMIGKDFDVYRRR